MSLHLPFAWNQGAMRVFALAGVGEIRAVGGCVRDALLGISLKDIDFATTLLPQEIMARAEKAGMAPKPTGLDHGTVTLVFDKQAFEITTLRKDVETDGRRAVIAYTTDWAEDAQRRDFTINAFYADANGNIIDGSLQGVEDLAARRLRFIGDAQTRIREDYLRILRLFRFAASLPGFSIDPEALNACKVTMDGLKTLSHERVTAEWLKLLQGNAAANAIAAMRDCGLDTYYKVNTEAGARLQMVAGLQPSVPLLLALAFEEGLPEAIRPPVKAQKERDLILTLSLTEMSVEEAVYRHGRDIGLALYLFRAAAQHQEFEAREWARLSEYAPPQSPVKSADFIAKGLEGPALGAALRAAEERWIGETFPTDPPGSN